jgi:hypothetical protein
MLVPVLVLVPCVWHEGPPALIDYRMLYFKQNKFIF